MTRSFFSDIKKGMEAFGLCIAALVNTILLGLVYAVGVGFTSLLAKICGKHFLDTSIRDDEASYWLDLHLKKKSMDEYYRQF